LEIDNNGAERSLRGIAVGRRTGCSMGATTVDGQRRPDQLHTTCKRLGIDPFAYLRDIFERISTHPAAARRAASRPMACCAADHPNHLSVSCRDLLWCKNDFFLSAVSW